MGKSSGLGVGVSKLVWINESWSSSSRTCWFTPYCYTGVAVGPVSQSSAGWLGLLVSVCGNYRQVGLFRLLGGLWTAWNGRRPIAPNKQNMEIFPVWPERPWLPVHSSVSSEAVRGYSLCLEKPQDFKMILERAEASPLAGPLQSEEIFLRARVPSPGVLRLPGHFLPSLPKWDHCVFGMLRDVQMPPEPCCSPVVWTFRWGRGRRVLGPSRSLDSLCFLCCSGLLWNVCFFQEQSQRLALLCSQANSKSGPFSFALFLTPRSAFLVAQVSCFITENGGFPNLLCPGVLWWGNLSGDEGNTGSNSLRPRTALIQLSLMKGSHHLLLITKALIVVAATLCFKWCLPCSMMSLTQERARGTAGSQYLSRGTVNSLSSHWRELWVDSEV